jgi:molybdate transport system regulatory protein
MTRYVLAKQLGAVRIQQLVFDGFPLPSGLAYRPLVYCLCGLRPMADTRISIRLDLTRGDRIGPGKIALLEAIRTKGSITAAARHLGMSYRRAWMLVDQINGALREPAVGTKQGGRHGGGTILTPTGDRLIELYHTIEELARTSAREEFGAIAKLVRQRERART